MDIKLWIYLPCLNFFPHILTLLISAVWSGKRHPTQPSNSFSHSFSCIAYLLNFYDSFIDSTDFYWMLLWCQGSFEEYFLDSQIFFKIAHSQSKDIEFVVLVFFLSFLPFDCLLISVIWDPCSFIWGCSFNPVGEVTLEHTATRASSVACCLRTKTLHPTGYL